MNDIPTTTDREIIGEGVQGKIYLEGDSVVKEYFHGLSSEQAKKLRIRRKAVIEAKLPTYEHYDVDERNGVCRMSDLSDGNRNLVVSTPDVLNTRIRTQSEIDLWMNIVRSRGGIRNMEEFFSDNRQIVRNALQSNVFVGSPGYFMVVKPGGYAHMIIGDYDDGVAYEPNYVLGDQEKRLSASKYLNLLVDVVGNFFPTAKARIREEVTSFKELYQIESYLYADLLAAIGGGK